MVKTWLWTDGHATSSSHSILLLSICYHVTRGDICGVQHRCILHIRRALSGNWKANSVKTATYRGRRQNIQERSLPRSLSAVPRSYNIHLWRFTWHLLALLLPQHSPFLTASAASLRGLPTGWTDNKPVKAALWGGINPELGLRWMMCSRGLLIQGEGGWHKKPCEVWTPERLPAVMSCCYFKRGTAAVTWLDLSGDISNGRHPFYPPFHPFFTTLLNHQRSR